MKKITIILLIFSALTLTTCKKLPELKVYELNLANENVAYSQTSAEITVDYEYPTQLQYVNVTMSRSNYFDYSFVARAEVQNGRIIANFVDLQIDKNYYYKFEYSNGVNLTTSDVHSFYLDAANVTLPTVITMEIYEVQGNTAVGGGEIIDDGGYYVTARGVCWATHRNPTIFDRCTTDGMGTGNYTSTMTDLEPNSIYYVRAHAINEKGTSYGTEFSFETFGNGGGGGNVPTFEDGFSVSPTQRVFFSKGNLQYQASTNIFRFAENQWDYVGAEYDSNSGTLTGSSNNSISSTYGGWIDLFGWGTSGYEHGAECYQPWSSDGSASKYYAYGNSIYNLSDQTGKADWGFNAIDGNEEGFWRTLTKEEWDYLIHTRSTLNDIRYAPARVNSVSGLILLPDNWDPAIHNLYNVNHEVAEYTANSISATKWTELFEPNGAIFLPTTGFRHNNDVALSKYTGGYWSSSHYSDSSSYIFLFDDERITTLGDYRNLGYGVRLVRDAE